MIWKNFVYNQKKHVNLATVLQTHKRETMKYLSLTTVHSNRRYTAVLYKCPISAVPE